MSRSGKWFWALVAAQALFLVGWAGYHEVVRQHAPVLRLKAYPADPRDVLRGDYMVLRYDISTVPSETGTATALKSGETVWVTLAPSGPYYRVTQVSRDKSTPKPGELLVTGRIGYDRRGAVGHTVEYGIEHYFVPEGRGSPSRAAQMEVEASVSSAHRLYLRQLFLDGKPYP